MTQPAVATRPVIWLAPDYRSPRWLATALQVAFVGWTALAAVTAAANLVQYRLVARLTDNPMAVTLSQAQASDDRRALLGRIALALGIATAILFIAWTRRLYINLYAFNTDHLRFGKGWAVGGWLVPLLNFVRPKQIIDDIWRASDPGLPPQAGREWQGRPVPLLLHLWWVAFVVGVAGGWVLAQIVIGEEIATRTDAALILGAGILTIAEAILAFWVVTLMTDRHVERAGLLAEPPHDGDRVVADGAESGGRRGRLRLAALPALAVLLGSAAFVAWNEPSAVVDAAALEGDTASYADHGVVFDYPAHLVLVEDGEPNRLNGVVVAGDLDGTHVITVGWMPSAGAKQTLGEMRALVPGAIRAMPAEPVGGVTTVARGDEMAVRQSFTFEEGGARYLGVAGTTTCESGLRSVIVIVLADSAIDVDVTASFRALLRSLYC